MVDQIPVNPKVLRWARETAGYSVEEVVEQIKRKRITAQVIQSWENGQASPSYPQLETLAYKIFNRPLAIFFFPDPPDEETPKQSFRTLPQEEIDLIDAPVLYQIRQARAMLENLRDLYNRENPAAKKIWVDINIRNFSSVPKASMFVREYLDVGFNVQYSLKSTDDALKYWRDLLEKHGIFIFKDAFKDEECSGFCLYDPVFPIIYLNNSQPKIRQIFTLIHELGHLLFGTGGVDFRHNDFIQHLRGENKHIEVFCNNFAGEFLVPTIEIKLQIQNKKIDDNLLSQLAKKFSVSREVILRKCLDLNYVTQTYYNMKVEEWEKERLGREISPGGNYYRTQGTYLSGHYVDTAFQKYYQSIISKTQLADYLGMKETNLNKFEGYVLHRDS